VVCFQCAHRWDVCDDCGCAHVLNDNDNIHSCEA
jgi:hypothetical protein